MFERFTQRARDVVRRAQVEAVRLGPGPIGTEHLLLGLLADPDSLAVGVLRSAGIDCDRLRTQVEEQIPRGPLGLDQADAAALREIGIDPDLIQARIEESLGAEALARTVPQQPRRRFGLGRRDDSGRFSPRAKKVLELSLREALYLRHNHIGTEHVLLGLLREGDGLAALVLTRAGIDLAQLRRRVSEALRAQAA
ncbi:MAG TPA: Clp protease N-terminal domain-containing protein [Micromonospora sp.]